MLSLYSGFHLSPHRSLCETRSWKGTASAVPQLVESSRALQAPEKLGFVSGRDFSAVTTSKLRASQVAERPHLYQDTTLRAAQKLCLVSGHDFSRAENDQEKVRALAPAVVASPKFSGNQLVPHPL